MKFEIASLTLCPMDGVVAAAGVSDLLMVELVDGPSFGFIALQRAAGGGRTVSCEDALVIVDRRNPSVPRPIRQQDRAPLEQVVAAYLAELGPGSCQ